MRIRFGGFFGRIWDGITAIFHFGKAVKESTEYAKTAANTTSSGHDNEVINVEIKSEDIKDLAEQVGLFEKINLTDPAKIDAFCGSAAQRFNSSNKTIEDLKAILTSTLQEETQNIDQNTLNLFAESFKETYLYNN